MLGEKKKRKKKKEKKSTFKCAVMAERSIPQKTSSEARAVTPWTSWPVDAAIRERQSEKTKQSVAAKWQLAAAFGNYAPTER